MLTWYGEKFEKGDKVQLTDVGGETETFTLVGVTTKTFDKIEVTINGFPQKASETVIVVADVNGREFWSSMTSIYELIKVQ